MKLLLNKADKNKVISLLENKENNIIIADMLLDFFSYVDAIDSAENEKEYLSKMMEFWELDPDSAENLSILHDLILPGLKELETSIIRNNPYYKIITNKASLGPYSLDFQTYYPYQGFSYDEITITDNYKEISKVGYFKEQVKFPVLKEGKKVWMSLNPNEIKTMEPDINKARGHIVIYGLGLGYFPFMICEKENVKSITIIERDSKIIEMFNKHILPRFPQKHCPISIIQGDALKYKNLQKADFAYVDLWHDPSDGLPIYIKMKRIEKQFPNCEFHYWLEPSILSLYRRCYLTVVEESMHGYGDSNYQSADNFTDEVINDIYFKTKNLVINSYEALLDNISDNSLKKLMIQSC